jgi:uncharacterized surface protein with fasciclin (FAS1) repeats
MRLGMSIDEGDRQMTQTRISAASSMLFAMLAVTAMTADARGGRGDTLLELLRQTDGAQAVVAATEIADASGCGIGNALASPSAKVVLLAPSNRAFEAFVGATRGSFDRLTSGQIRTILSATIDSGDACGLLRRHVATGQGNRNQSSLASLVAAGQIAVDDGSVWPISVSDGDVTINYESEVGLGDITRKNGVVHFLKSVIKNEPPPAEDAVTVFVTTTTHDGNLGGLGGADDICQARADAVGLGGTGWSAWLTDSTNPFASWRIPSGEYRRVDGTLVAENLADLIDGELQAPINLNEYGQLTSALVWTAAQADGSSIGNNCNDWTDSSSEQGGCPDPADPNCGSTGSTSATNSEWTKLNAAAFQCNSFQRLYCFGIGESQ